MADVLDVPFRSLTTRTTGFMLHLIGLGFVVWFTLTVPAPQPFTVPVVLFGVLCWLAAAGLGWFDRPDLAWMARARVVLWSVVLLLGAVTGGAGAGTSYALVAGGLFALFATITTPLAWTGIVTVVAAAVAWVSMAVTHAGPTAAPQLLLWTVVGVGGGLIRRQRALEQRAERRRLADDAANAALVERARIARDVHDVLAHSLGGLVVQLDATEAILESRGVDADVLARVAASRALAVEGLAEAKRAVDALRGVDQPLAVALDALAAGAEAIGGARVRFTQSGRQHPIDAGVTDAFVGIVREALTNARKHAPGVDVDVELRWMATSVRVRVVNPLRAGAGSGVGAGAGEQGAGAGNPPDLAASGGGHGIVGMRERADAVGASFSAVAQGGTWSVEVEVVDVREF